MYQSRKHSILFGLALFAHICMGLIYWNTSYEFTIRNFIPCVVYLVLILVNLRDATTYLSDIILLVDWTSLAIEGTILYSNDLMFNQYVLMITSVCVYRLIRRRDHVAVIGLLSCIVTYITLNALTLAGMTGTNTISPNTSIAVQWTNTFYVAGVSIYYTINSVAMIRHTLDTLQKEAALIMEDNNRLRESNKTDGLTGLYNRVCFDSIVEGLKFTDTDKSLILIDIDFFKQVNDSYSHSEGDEILSYLANSIKKSIRAGDKGFRWGGDEFAVLVDGNVSTAKLVAERISKSFSSNRLGVTLSMGIASTSEETSNMLLFNKADKALYKSKGVKNTITIYEEN